MGGKVPLKDYKIFRVCALPPNSNNDDKFHAKFATHARSAATDEWHHRGTQQVRQPVELEVH
jgi:hypothetical protein